MTVANFKKWAEEIVNYSGPQIDYTEFRENLIMDSHEELLEALITFGGQAYPRFGNVIILAGGVASGKSFVKDKLIGVEGFSFDVDELKRLIGSSEKINKMVKSELGIDLRRLSANLTNPDNVAKLHAIIGDHLNLPDRRLKALYTSILTAPAERKPNIIFDVTLKDLQKLEKLTNQVQSLGYDPKRTHIVWVVNDIEIALRQNHSTARGRVVPDEILINTHRGANSTMYDIVTMGKRLKKYMDGDIVFAFNKVNVDSTLEKSGRGGSYFKDANYFYVKRAGKDVLPIDAISQDIRRKIDAYVPKSANWKGDDVSTDMSGITKSRMWSASQ